MRRTRPRRRVRGGTGGTPTGEATKESGSASTVRPPTQGVSRRSVVVRRSGRLRWRSSGPWIDPFDDVDVGSSRLAFQPPAAVLGQGESGLVGLTALRLASKLPGEFGDLSQPGGAP